MDERSGTFLGMAADEATRRRAARLGARRVEVRGVDGVACGRQLVG